MSTTYMHHLWDCSKIAKFWSYIAKELSTILKYNICKDPGQFLLGLPSKGILDSWRSKLLNKLSILFNWIKKEIEWYGDIFSSSHGQTQCQNKRKREQLHKCMAATDNSLAQWPNSERKEHTGLESSRPLYNSTHEWFACKH